MTKTLDHLYEKLTAAERFKAFMQALDQSDFEAIEQINHTCPKVRYVGEDMRFGMRKLQFFMLTFFALAELRQTEHQVSLTLIGLLRQRDESSAKQMEDLVQKVIDAMAKMLARLAGWEAFCAEIGVPPWAALETMQITPLAFADSFRRTWPDLADIEPSATSIKAEQDMWRSMWHAALAGYR
jgi:hypothetical protein